MVERAEQMARNLYKEVTDRIVNQLKAGVVPWQKTWSGKGFGIMPRNAVTGRAYSGVNVLLLWSRAQESGYSAPLWLTFKQAQEAGGKVRKGEKSEVVVFVSAIEKENEKGETYRIPFLKAFNVFNVAQIDGLPQTIDPKPIPQNEEDRIAEAEQFLASTGANIRHGESRAYFRPVGDLINLPPFETFTSASAYYATAFHELTHWTGAEARLNRTFGKRFGDQAYSAEELVAELGSAFLCAEFGFDTKGNDAAYIDHWIKFLTDHDQAIVAAASAASKACDYLRGLAVAEEIAEAA